MRVFASQKPANEVEVISASQMLLKHMFSLIKAWGRANSGYAGPSEQMNFSRTLLRIYETFGRLVPRGYRQ